MNGLPQFTPIGAVFETAANERPVNAAGRFSMKCATPSLKSSEPNDLVTSMSAVSHASASDWK